jgi:signal transduction histidine kinase
MVKRAESFREDEEGFFLNEEGGSEFTQLSKALNQMLYRISQNKKELKSTVRSLEKANLDLKKAQNDIINAEKMASVGRLSAGIAHEIGNPIAIILGYLELLKQKDISEDQRNDFISRTENEINRVNTIIRQLLDLSRPGGGDLKPVPVHQIISDIVNVFKVQPLASRMRLEIDLSATEDTVKADPSQLRQVFLNLLINAADAISSTGSPEGRLLIMTGVEHGADDFPLLKIMFTDNGPGILQEHLVKIFDPFYTTKPPGKGTGLGLSVCFMIIEALRGKIKADSEPGKGTTMTIHLPLYAGENNDVPHKTAG